MKVVTIGSWHVSQRYPITFMWNVLCWKIKKICICLITATYFLSKKSLPYCKECRAQCSSSGKEYCQRITECRKRRLKGSMLKVNLLFIVKKTWFRQPLNAEYVTFPADRSSQRRPANMATFGEPLAQPPMFFKSKDPPVCEKLHPVCVLLRGVHFPTFNVRTLYQTGKLDQLLRGTQNLSLNIIGIQERWWITKETVSQHWNDYREFMLIYFSASQPRVVGVGLLNRNKFANSYRAAESPRTNSDSVLWGNPARSCLRSFLAS